MEAVAVWFGDSGGWCCDTGGLNRQFYTFLGPVNGDLRQKPWYTPVPPP